MNDTEKVTVTFRRSISASHQIFIEFDDELKGLENFVYLWINKDRRQDAYNNWNFTKPGPWDSDENANMWYSSNSTNLGHTVNYIIGKEQIEKINLEIQPIKYIYKDKNVSSSLLGITLGRNDVVVNELLIHATDDFNVNY